MKAGRANIKGRLAKLVGSTPLALIPVRVRKGPAKGARWTLAPFSANWRKGGSENDVRAALSRLGDCQGRVFWDMGAHFGIHTVGFAFQSGPSGQVVAFEPDPAAFSRLARHVRMNRLPHVRLFEAAASDRCGVDILYLAGSSNSHIKYNSWDLIPNEIQRQQIRLIALDEILEHEGLRLPDFIKVDVQGHGGSALHGCKKTIARSMPLIVFSNHSRREQDEVTNVLRPLGYIPEDLYGNTLAWGSSFDEVIFIPPAALTEARSISHA